MRCLLVFLSLLSWTSSFKFLVFSPQFARSHANFLAKLTDVLADAGHEVVMVSEVFDTGMGDPGTKKARVIEIPQSERSRQVEEFLNSDGASDYWTEKPLREGLKAWGETQELFAEQCRDNVLHPDMIAMLKKENFDAAFVESFGLCGPVLFHLLGIEKWAMAESLAYNDGWFFYTQTPSNPAYVPSMMGGVAGERMNFLQRIYNVYITLLITDYYTTNMERLTRYVRTAYPDLPHVSETIANNSLVFFNTEPLIDFARPSSARIIEIGGIVVAQKPQPLNETWSSILDLRPHTVYISFGTFAKAYLMPRKYMDTLLEVIKRFPNVTFILKYEKPEHGISKGIDNLIESAWVPQRDLLHDPRLSAFITHCGQGSTTESIDAGVPLIVIPIMGDQYRNAHQLKKAGLGLMLDKSDLERPEPLQAAMEELLRDDSYRQRAAAVREMIADKPFSAREKFVRNMEFLAKHGPLRQLDHYGRHLNFIQYYLIDIVASIVVVIVVLVLVLSTIVRSVLRRFLGSKVKQA